MSFAAFAQRETALAVERQAAIQAQLATGFTAPVESIGHLFQRGLFNRRPGKRGKPVWPAPVYVGTFANGRQVRMTFWQQAGKPLDYEDGRQAVQIIGLSDDHFRPAEGQPSWQEYTPRQDWGNDDLPYRRPLHCVPLVAGHVEMNGQKLPDPAFEPIHLAAESKPKRANNKALVAELLATLEAIAAAPDDDARSIAIAALVKTKAAA